MFRAKARAFGGWLDAGTIFWAGTFAAAFHWGPGLARRGWGRFSGGQQFLIATLCFRGFLLAPVFVGCYILSGYIGYWAFSLAVPISMLLFPKRTESSEDNVIRRFEYKHFAVRMLWRESRTRTCKTCGYFDSATRDVRSAPGASQSIHDRCPGCGGTSFELHMLDYHPGWS